MVFSSYSFILLFLPLVLLGFFLSAKVAGTRGAMTWLLLSSLVFYGWWDYRYVVLLLLSITFNFWIGARIVSEPPSSPGRATLLIAGVTANLLLLGFYKYAGFVARNIGISFEEPSLPLGISFFTLTQIAFLVDASRGVASEYRPVNYGLFVTYFPHLLAGPLYHHREMMPQFESSKVYRLRPRLFVAGLTLFVIGLCKKVLLADSLAPAADSTFQTNPAALDAVGAWVGALAYSLQLYFDFSGYSDMAIGISLMLGIRLPLNFDSPYKATSIIDFWRRWHMTLSRFLRAYVYIPLGGNKLGSRRRYINLLATMLLGGLWHGAAWQFILWGGLHGVYLVVNHLWRVVCPQVQYAPPGIGRSLRLLSVMATFLAVTCAWVPFRADGITSAFGMFRAMIGQQGSGKERLLSEFRVVATRFMATLDTYHPSNPIESLTSVFLSALEATYLNWFNALPSHLVIIFLALLIVFLAPNSQQITGLRRLTTERDALTNYRVSWRPTILMGIAIGVGLAAALYKLLTTPSPPFLYFNF